MSWARPLYELQEIELELRKREKTLAQIERELQDDSQLKAAQQAVEEEEKTLALLQKQQRSFEWDLEDLKVKLKQQERKLYGGKVTDHKELISLQQDIEQRKEQCRKKEEEILEIMMKVEEVQKALEEKKRLLMEAKVNWANRKQLLSQRREELLKEISNYRQRYELQLSLLDSKRLELYKQFGQGEWVAKVEAGRCGGCQIILSLAEIQRARHQPIFCPHCHRLLYIP